MIFEVGEALTAVSILDFDLSTYLSFEAEVNSFFLLSFLFDV
jgi:hypothetical protein